MALTKKKPMSQKATSKMAHGGRVGMEQNYLPPGSALPQVNTPKSSVRGNGAAIKAKPPAGLF